jgi:hypothetical protein
MNCRTLLGLITATGAWHLTACSSEEELHSGSPCLENQHQECKGDDEKIRCTCVENDAGTGADGADTADGDPADSAADSD